MNHIKYPISGMVLLLLFSLNSALADSYTVDSVPNPYQQSEVIYVVDPNNILDPIDTTTINQRLKSLEQQTTIEAAVVALPSIGQVDTREFANKLFNHWKIGKKDQDNGLLILLVIDQRQVVFEVGYGLEGNLTDAKSYRLMEQYMLPLFKQNQFSQGMVEGVDGVAAYLEQQNADGTLYSIASNNSSIRSFLGNYLTNDLIGIKFYIAVTIAILLLIYCFWGDRIFLIKNWSTARYISPLGRFIKALLYSWPCLFATLILSGSAFKTFTNFVLKGFTISSVLLIAILICSIIFFILKTICRAIFAIFKIKNKIQKSPKKLICSTCRHRSLVELTENKQSRLSTDEQYLMSIGAVTYRLFECERASCHATFKGQKININWKLCPNCQLPTNKLIDRQKVAPTYTQTGLLTKYYRCVKCQKESIETIILECERDRDSSSSSGGSRGGSSGGSSSSGSRGGGSSGGGGARGSF